MEAGAAVLLRSPWLPVSVGGCQLLAKIWFGDSAEYHILLSDMAGVWEERMDSAAIQSRAQELNRRLRAPVAAFFSHLRQVAQPGLTGGDGEAQISLTRREDDGGGGGVVMRLRSELAGLPFYWEFHCAPAPVPLVCAQLVRPLLAMSRLLQRQVEQLGALLVRKDAEIQDYRENGATLSRERLQTDVFEERTYREDFMAKALPLLCAERRDVPGFDARLRQLYAAVVDAHAATAARKRKRTEEEEEEEERPVAVAPDPAPSPGGGGEAAQSDGGPSAAADGRHAASPPRPPQSRPATSVPAERPSSKPKKKKKKVVGLFR